MKSVFRTVAVIAALAAVPAAGALARPHGMGGGFDPARMCQDMDARHAGMLAYAEARLQLTDAQKPAFKALSDTLAAAHEPMRKLCADPGFKETPAAVPARLDRMQKMMEARMEASRLALPAIKDFYGQLSPEQRASADRMMAEGRGGMMGRMRQQ